MCVMKALEATDKLWLKTLRKFFQLYPEITVVKSFIVIEM